MRTFSSFESLLLCLSCSVLVAKAAILGQHGCSTNPNGGNWQPVMRLLPAHPLRKSYDYYVGYHMVKNQRIRFSAEIAQDGLPNFMSFRNRPGDDNVKVQNKAQYRMNVELNGGDVRRYWLDSDRQCQNTLQWIDFQTANVVAFSVDVLA